MEALFQKAGYQIVSPQDPADVFVVNSCTVTATGDAKSRRALSRAKAANPEVITVMTGCSPQAFPDQSGQWGADVVSGTAGRARILENIELFMMTRQPVIDIEDIRDKKDFEELPVGPAAGRTRAFVKIQDGCSRRCAYCVIPTARGPARSRGQAEILAEVGRLAGLGYREVVFTGINLSSYGQDTGTCLPDIVDAVAQVPGIARIRLSSMEPDHIKDFWVDRFAAQPKLCPHFHLSLQSGCQKTLGAMRRPYTPAQYAAVVQKLRAALPQASFTTDVIVGFPGESREDFAESLAFVKAQQFLKVHVFPFSPRQGTAAADFDQQVPQAEKNRRAKELQQAADAVREAWIQSQQGARFTVLLEAPLPGGEFSGYTESYIPVSLPAQGHQTGDLAEVELGAFDGARCPCTES